MFDEELYEKINSTKEVINNLINSVSNEMQLGYGNTNIDVNNSDNYYNDAVINMARIIANYENFKLEIANKKKEIEEIKNADSSYTGNRGKDIIAKEEEIKGIELKIEEYLKENAGRYNIEEIQQAYENETSKVTPLSNSDKIVSTIIDVKNKIANENLVDYLEAEKENLLNTIKMYTELIGKINNQKEKDKNLNKIEEAKRKVSLIDGILESINSINNMSLDSVNFDTLDSLKSIFVTLDQYSNPTDLFVNVQYDKNTDSYILRMNYSKFGSFKKIPANEFSDELLNGYLDKFIVTVAGKTGEMEKIIKGRDISITVNGNSKIVKYEDAVKTILEDKNNLDVIEEMKDNDIINSIDTSNENIVSEENINLGIPEVVTTPVIEPILNQEEQKDVVEQYDVISEDETINSPEVIENPTSYEVVEEKESISDEESKKDDEVPGEIISGEPVQNDNLEENNQVVDDLTIQSLDNEKSDIINDTRDDNNQKSNVIQSENSISPSIVEQPRLYKPTLKKSSSDKFSESVRIIAFATLAGGFLVGAPAVGVVVGTSLGYAATYIHKIRNKLGFERTSRKLAKIAKQIDCEIYCDGNKLYFKQGEHILNSEQANALADKRLNYLNSDGQDVITLQDLLDVEINKIGTRKERKGVPISEYSNEINYENYPRVTVDDLSSAYAPYGGYDNYEYLLKDDKKTIFEKVKSFIFKNKNNKVNVTPQVSDTLDGQNIINDQNISMSNSESTSNDIVPSIENNIDGTVASEIAENAEKVITSEEQQNSLAQEIQNINSESPVNTQQASPSLVEITAIPPVSVEYGSENDVVLDDMNKDNLIGDVVPEVISNDSLLKELDNKDDGRQLSLTNNQ